MTRILLLFASVFLLSCQNNTVFEHTKKFENHRWNRFDLIEAEFDLSDPAKLYDLQLILVNQTSYSYDFISLNVTLYFPDETIRSRDIEIRLQDKNLLWLGKVNDEKVTTPFSFIKGLKLPEKGKIRIRIENKMSKLNLEGVESLGFLLTVSE
jgi:gliding motility-associated lipoprotein GldH